MMVVYKLTCKCCGKYYIGNTSRKLKVRVREHRYKVKCLLKGWKVSATSFSRHIAHHMRYTKEEEKAWNDDRISRMFDVEILWKGPPITTNKSFRKYNCRLCMKERMFIYKAMKEEPHLVLKDKTELYGECRHVPKFHRFL